MSAPLTLPHAEAVLAIEAAKAAIGRRIAGIDRSALTAAGTGRLFGIVTAALPLVEGWAALTAAGDVPEADVLDDYAAGFAAVGKALDAFGGAA